MRCACIDIGSNTTRVLVADVIDGRLREGLIEREVTRLGGELRQTGALSEGAGDAVSATVVRQRGVAEVAGAERVRVVATAAIRAAANREQLCAAVRARSGLPVDVLDGVEEARLAFEGAVRTLPKAPPSTVGVVD